MNQFGDDSGYFVKLNFGEFIARKQKTQMIE